MNKIKEIIKKNKIQITVLMGVVLVFVAALIIGNSFADPNSGYLKNVTIDGISFENASLVYEDGISTFMVEVYNESGDTYELKTISINVTDEDSNVTTLTGYIGNSLDKDEYKLLSASIDKDLSSAVSTQYVINK